MTVSSTTRKAGPFAGNAVTTAFPFTFKVFDKTDVGVTLLSISGVVTTLTLDSDYSVTLSADQNASPGGSILYPITGSPLPTGAKLVIDGTLPYEQPTSLTNQGGFYPNVIEDALDRDVIMIQQLAELADRSLHFPADEGSLFSGELPAAVARASRALIFDANGNPVVSSEAYQEPSVLLSSASADAAAQIVAATPGIIGTAVGTADAHTAAMIAGIQIPTFQAFVPTVLRDGTDYTSGTSTSVTLPVTALPKVIAGVFFDTGFQSSTQWMLGTDDRTLSFNGPIPQGVSEVNVAYLSPALLGTFFQSGFGVIGRTFQDKMRESVSVEDFGARGDGVTDCTAAVAAADAAARAHTPPLRVEFGNGVYMGSRFTFHANSNWSGHGRATILRQIVGSNQDFVYGSNSAANFGLAGSAATNFPYNFSLRDFVIDGNWNGGTGNTAGSGLVCYGDHFELKNIYITNCAEHGRRTEFQGDSSIDYASAFLESSCQSMWVDYVGGHGVWDNGPHDMHDIDVHVLDASQSADSTYDGFYLGPNSSSRKVACHPATRSGRLRMRYSVNAQPGATHEFVACNIEGAGVANLGLFSSGCIFDSSCRYYAAWNGVNILLGGTNCSLNLIRGMLQGPPGGRPVCVGIQFSNTAGDHVNNNDIDVTMAGQEGGNIVFTDQDSGQNTIRVRFYNNANVNIFGTPHASDDIVMTGAVSGGSTLELNTRDQLYSVPVDANSSVSVTFAYPFPKTPVVEITPIAGADPMTEPLWLSSRTTDGITIVNGNASALVVDIRARGVY